MGDLAGLITAVAALVGAIGTTTAVVITALRASPRERRRAARGALDRLKEAAADGEITPEELADVLRADRDDEGGEDP